VYRAARNVVVIVDGVGFGAQTCNGFIFLGLTDFHVLVVMYLFELADVVVAMSHFGGDLDVGRGTSRNY
jgi:hypothetical protein